MSQNTKSQCLFTKKNGTRCKIKPKNESHCIYHKEYDQCGICLEDITFKQFKKLDCNHTFHKICIERWYLNKSTCPLCRKECIDLLPITNEYFRSLVKRPYYGPYFLGPEVELPYDELELMESNYTDVYDGEVLVSENVIRPFMY